MFDYHMHTSVSYDSQSSPEEMARAAVAAGLKEICFTDHMDYQSTTPREEYAYEADAYRQAYEHLSIPGLTIRLGTEVGLADWNKEVIVKDLQEFPYDFVMGSIHFVQDQDVYFPEFWADRHFLEAERLYFETMLHCVQLHDDFDVLGHLTYISKVKGNPNPRLIPLEDHRDVIAAIMKTLITKGKGMEINTSGMDRCGDFLPGLPYLKLFRDLGGEIVTIGSDAHTPDQVGQYIGEACAVAREIFGHVCTYQKHQPIFHNL